jgi:predicted acyltransferase
MSVTGMPRGSNRLFALDVFRGATIAAMELVNNPGRGPTYAPLSHAKWAGWTLADTIAPAFLWIVGLSLVLSVTHRVQNGASRRTLLLHSLRRAAVLFALGLYYSNLYDLIPITDWGFLHTFKILSILQRIAVCYLVASVLVLWCSRRTQVIWTVAFLVLYWVMLTSYPVPGYGAGYLERPGHVAYYVDQLVFGSHAHLGEEGVLSYLAAIATTMFGVFTGQMLLRLPSPNDRLVKMFVGASVLAVAGMMMAWWVPLIRGLWTPSYAVFMAGLSLQAFAVIYWLVDVRGIRTGMMPLVALGRNAILIFVLSGTLAHLLGVKGVVHGGQWVPLKSWVFDRMAEVLPTPQAASLVFASGWLGMMLLVAWVMHRRGWIVRV